MSSVEVSINQLPVINQVTSSDFLIIQTPNATNRLNFSDFVIGLDNTTFKNTIETNTTNIEILSANSDPVNLAPLSAAVVENTTNIETLSTRVLGLETLSGTFAETLSVINLSADNLTINGELFRGYPKYAQTIYTGTTSRTGDGGTAVDLDMEVNLNLADINSKLKISFAIPGVVNTGDNTCCMVLQYSQDGTGWSDIPEFLGGADPSALQGTVFLGTDSNEEGSTASFNGIWQPPLLGTNNIIYIRVRMRLLTASIFRQNQGGVTTAPNNSDGRGISILTVEEFFTSS